MQQHETEYTMVSETVGRDPQVVGVYSKGGVEFSRII
jgi:hypothetical protein